MNVLHGVTTQHHRLQGLCWSLGERLWMRGKFPLLYFGMGFFLLALLVPCFSWADDEIKMPIAGNGVIDLPASINGGSGKVGRIRAGADVSLKTDYITVNVSVRRDFYSWYKTNRLPFGNGHSSPWEGLNRVGIGLHHSGALSKRFDYFAWVDASASYEKEISGSLGITAGGGGVWTPSPEWAVRLGAGVVWHQIKSYPFPVLDIMYRPRALDGMEFELGFPYSHIAFQLNNVIGLRLTGEVEYGLYRLADKSSVRRKGYVEFFGYSTGLWVDISPTESLKFSFGGAWNFQGGMSLYRESGEGHKEYSREDVPSLNAALRYEF
ncbi:hypothetical protein [Desulfovibrio inopinatus]|uniref:hypothetical protein n=1 Tax=Desulfovibrio inopinatus TaxID=102109 RepID=UPI00040D3E50|nr:hypothetical protein [Desulfovibrio inopinatus]